MKRLFLILAAAAAGTASAIDWSNYKQVAAKAPAVKLINPAFERGAEGWRLTREAKIDPHGGSNMSKGVMIERTNPGVYTLSFQRVPDLVPGMRYNIEAMVRCENVKKGDLGGASIFIEHSDKNGKYIALAGSFPVGITGTTGWTKIKINGHKMPVNGKYTTVGFYFRPKATGKAWFDDFRITPAEVSWSIYPLNAPVNRVIKGEALKLRIADGNGSFPAGKMKAWIKFGKKECVTDVKNGTAVFPASAGYKGKGKVQVRVFDPVKKVIHAEQFLDLAFGSAPARVSFDSKGRTIINGKKFLLLGAYANFYKHTADIFAAAGFNAVLSGNLFHASVGGKKGFEGIRSCFDYAHKKNLKLIFCTNAMYPWGNIRFSRPVHGVTGIDNVVKAIVKTVKDHPALLAWYTADEVSQQFIPDLAARKKLIQDLDPEHPVYQIHCLGYNTSSFVPFGTTTDVIGLDHYPLRHPAVSKLDALEPKLKETFKSGLPHWFCPQMFCSRRYSAKDKTSLFPNDGEFLGQLLIAAGCGVKGYIFYTAEVIARPDKRYGDPAQTLKTIKYGLASVRKMERFILADKAPVKINAKASKGKVSAWRFTDDKGKSAVAIVSLVPGEHQLQIPLKGNYTSYRGKTVLSKGKALFKAKNIDCDILFEK